MIHLNHTNLSLLRPPAIAPIFQEDLEPIEPLNQPLGRDALRQSSLDFSSGSVLNTPCLFTYLCGLYSLSFLAWKKKSSGLGLSG
jgi:hypothetical protein